MRPNASKSGVEYIDKGDFFLKKVDGELMRCVACRQPMEFGKKSRLARHKCSLRFEAARRAAETAADKEDDPEEPSMLRRSESIFRTFGQRLSDGFAILRGYY